ncbi:MAG: hypothetical protein QOF39_1698 [Frankiales bacterium]|jgi:hypothetical protein|nr:hypothetical protein [Frankiales bacterium]
MKFRCVILAAGRTATGLPVPDHVVSSLGAGRRPAVYVTIGSYTYRSTIAPYSEGFRIPLSAENRAGAGVAAGDEIDVELRLDTDPREAVVPEDFATALDADPVARQFFDGLSFSNKQSYLLWVTGAKTQETRARRVAQGVELLRGGRSHR